MRNELPETCFSTLPGTGDLIILKRGETGYYHSDWETGEKAQNVEIASQHNSRRGITPAQVEAMVAGSMFGFHVPGADPQFYYNKAKRINSYPLGSNSILGDPTDSFYKHIHGELLQFQVAGELCHYLDLAVIPEMITDLQGRAVLLPDLVCGKPLLPVSVTFNQETTGLIQMRLESGAFALDGERNAGYQITAKVRVGPVEYAMGERGGKFPSFVTWERTPANDGNGPPNYYWGHYFDSLDQAIQNFCDRASEKYEMLTEQRKPSIKAQLAAKPVPGDKPAARPKDREVR